MSAKSVRGTTIKKVQGSSYTYRKGGVLGRDVQSLDLIVLVDDGEAFGVVTSDNSSHAANGGFFSCCCRHCG